MAVSSQEPEALEIGKNFVESLRKTAIPVKDTPAFVANRLLVLQLLGADRMLEAGITIKEYIDTTMTLALNHPMGPLALTDLLCIDVIYFIAKAMYDETKDPQFIIPNLMDKMLADSWLGCKTDKGDSMYISERLV